METKKLRRYGYWIMIISIIAFFALSFLHVNAKSDLGSVEAQELAQVFMKKLIPLYFILPITFLIGLWFFLDSDGICSFCENKPEELTNKK